MSRRSFKAIETEIKLDENGERIPEFTQYLIPPNNTQLMLRNYRWNITCWNCTKVQGEASVEEINPDYWKALGGLPNDEPDCGFTGQKCEFNPNMVIIMATIVFVSMIVGLLYFIRKSYMNARLKSMIWLLRSEKITKASHKVSSCVQKSEYLRSKNQK